MSALCHIFDRFEFVRTTKEVFMNEYSSEEND